MSQSRATDWTQAGAGTIPARTTICSTFDPGTATIADINTAITNCPSGQTVFLNAGTYNFGAGGIVIDRSNITLRGVGPDATFLIFSASDPCGGINGLICFISPDRDDPDSPSNTANWTAGYAQGATSITLNSTTNLLVGTLLVLDQNTDTTDTGNIWQCTGDCTQGGGDGGPGRFGRSQMQIVTVTSISGGACPCTIGISPGLYMPNWRSGQSPGAWWASTNAITGVGVENLSIDATTAASENAIAFFTVTGSWVKNVRSSNPDQHHVKLDTSTHITVRDSYFFRTANHAQESYGIDEFMASDNLFENNIFQWITVPLMTEKGQGSVWGYNFTINDQFGPGNWMQASQYTHGGGSNYELYEGNDGLALTHDNYFGPAHFNTSFRNRWPGWEPQPAGLQNQTVAVNIYATNRYMNVIGNILGYAGYHTTYQTRAGDSTGNCIFSIYAIGLGSNCNNGGSAPFPANDTLVNTTLMRWGNWDTVNDATRWESSEVPSGLSIYANAVPGSQTLPNSFYLLEKPAFYGSQAWPSIGPDVTGGSVTAGSGAASTLGSHVYKIPARRCFEDVMGGSFGDTTPRTFNSDLCY